MLGELYADCAMLRFGKAQRFGKGGGIGVEIAGKFIAGGPATDRVRNELAFRSTQDQREQVHHGAADLPEMGKGGLERNHVLPLNLVPVLHERQPMEQHFVQAGHRQFRVGQRLVPRRPDIFGRDADLE
ncbi:MAG: hypothetical protein V4564_13365 [Pseudomonadota bacterium]